MAKSSQPTRTQVTNPDAVSLLKDIFSRRALIANPTRLDIPGFGEVTATSMVLEHYEDDTIVPYFAFSTPSGGGEFLRRNNQYFVEVRRTTT
jgi:hypothetical protein